MRELTCMYVARLRFMWTRKTGSPSPATAAREARNMRKRSLRPDTRWTSTSKSAARSCRCPVKTDGVSEDRIFDAVALLDKLSLKRLRERATSLPQTFSAR